MNPAALPAPAAAAARRLLADEQAALFCALLRREKLPLPVREYEFARETFGRRWRFDFAFVEQRVGVEVDGGVWTGGRHVRPAGFAEDRKKHNCAAALGWRVLVFLPADLCSVESLHLLARTLDP